MQTTQKASSKSSGGDKRKIVDLFPYKIKNRNNFYFRDHPVNKHPESRVYQTYWTEQLRYYIEGRWINDEGTWVFAMPKLYFYVNYARIYDDERRLIHPDLRDTEWIIFSYFLCIDGFSGFENDPDYTCHYLIKKIEDGQKLRSRERLKIPENCKKEDGSWKTYVDPWIYLTRHYLIDNPAEEPLGLPLYDNPRKNGILLSGRGTGKSMTTFVGDFVHEFLTSGIKRFDDIDHVNSALNFGLGCADSRQLDRSIANIKAFYDNMPGQFESEDGVFMGPYYKRVQGSWETGSQLQHVVKRKDRTDKIRGSLVQMVALTADKTKVGAGDRFRRIYIEEVGFLKNMFDVFRANKDSMIINKKKVGSFFGLGTGGDLKAIQEPKAMFERPEAYDIFGIPNYWKNEKKKVGLFIPAYYATEYRDNDGNAIIDEAYDMIIEEREKIRKDIDAISYESEIMFNPVTPDEMLRPSDGSVLPKQAAAKQLDNLETFDIFRNRAMIGDLRFNPLEKRGVEFKKDLTGDKKPILRWGSTAMETKSEGAFIMYEEPAEFIPEGLYYVIYDPVQKSGDGSSYNSALVYKNFYRGPEESLYDTIVAEWIGRKERLEDNYNMVIKMAKFYNARIFPETNIAGFVEWCSANNYYSLLEPDATYFLKQEINPNRKRDFYKVGFQMHGREKDWSLRKLRDWLLEVKRKDPSTGVPLIRTIDWIFSPRILDEIISYVDDKDYNFDHISSLLGLMILIGKLGKEPVDLPDDEEIQVAPEMQEYFERMRKAEMLKTQQRPRRAKFLQY